MVLTHLSWKKKTSAVVITLQRSDYAELYFVCLCIPCILWRRRWFPLSWNLHRKITFSSIFPWPELELHMESYCPETIFASVLMKHWTSRMKIYLTGCRLWTRSALRFTECRCCSNIQWFPSIKEHRSVCWDVLIVVRPLGAGDIVKVIPDYHPDTKSHTADTHKPKLIEKNLNSAEV